MNAIIEKLTKIKELSQRLECERHDDGFEFIFVIDDNALGLLEECQVHNIFFNSFCVDDLYVENEDLRLSKQKTCKALLLSADLRAHGLNVYWDWDALLAYKPNLVSVPKNYLILSEDGIYPTELPSGKMKHYEDVCDVLSILIAHADHTLNLTESIVDGLVFLHKSRLKIPIEFNAECLGEGLDGISVVNSMFEDPSHKEQKASILKEVLYVMLVNVSEYERLRYLIMNFGEFSKRLSENYQLFVSEFSFDDVRKEYEENKRDYLIKLNDIFASVFAKFIGIPVSLALVAFKMTALGGSITFWTNLLLFLSVVMYGSMMVMLIKNQMHTLGALKSEYESQMNRLRHQYVEQYEQIKNIQDELNQRHNYQKKCLDVFYCASILLVVVAVVSFAWDLPWTMILGAYEKCTYSGGVR